MRSVQPIVFSSVAQTPGQKDYTAHWRHLPDRERTPYDRFEDVLQSVNNRGLDLSLRRIALDEFAGLLHQAQAKQRLLLRNIQTLFLNRIASVDSLAGILEAYQNKRPRVFFFWRPRTVDLVETLLTDMISKKQSSGAAASGQLFVAA